MHSIYEQLPPILVADGEHGRELRGSVAQLGLVRVPATVPIVERLWADTTSMYSVALSVGTASAPRLRALAVATFTSSHDEEWISQVRARRALTFMVVAGAVGDYDTVDTLLADAQIGVVRLVARLDAEGVSI